MNKNNLLEQKTISTSINLFGVFLMLVSLIIGTFIIYNIKEINMILILLYTIVLFLYFFRGLELFLESKNSSGIYE